MIDCFNIRYRHKAAALQLPLAADHGPAANRDGIGTDLRTICHLTTAIFLSISSLHSSLQHKISSPEKYQERITAAFSALFLNTVYAKECTLYISFLYIE